MAKLMSFIEEMGTFLHPRVTEALKVRVWAARSEMAREAMDQKVSPSLQQLEPFLEHYRKDIEHFSAGGWKKAYLWHMRPLMAKIIELYGKPSQNIPEKLPKKL